MSQVSDDMRELSKLVVELKSMTIKTKELRARKKELMFKIQQYIETSGVPGLKFNELVVMPAESTTHKRLKKKEKEERIVKALEDSGIQNPEEIYTTICKASIGDEIISATLRIKTVLPEVF